MGEVLVEQVTLAKVREHLRRVQQVALEEGYFDPADRSFIVGRALVVDQLLDELMMGPPDSLDFLPESDERNLESGVLGRLRGAVLVRCVTGREGPGMRPQDLHLIVVDHDDDGSNLAKAWEAVYSQRERPLSPRLCEWVAAASRKTTLVDKGARDFVAETQAATR